MSLALTAILAGAASAQVPWGPQSWGETVRRAKNLAPEQPATVWEQQVDGVLAADLIEYLSEGRILVGLVRTTRLGEPRYDNIMMVNAADGAVLWEAERDQYAQASYSIAGTAPLLVLLAASDIGMSLTAFDTATGKRVWQYRAKPPFRLARPSLDRTLVLGKQGSGRRLEAIDALTGRVVWRQDFDSKAIGDSVSATLLVSGDTALVVGSSVTEISVRDGTVLRTLPLSTPATAASSAALAGGSVVTWSGTRIELIDRASGASRWSQTDSLPAQLVSVQSTSVLRVAKSGPRGIVERLRLDNGARGWRYQTNSPVVSAVAIVGDLVLFSTDSALIGVDTATGAARFVTALRPEVVSAGPSLARRIGIPDQIELRPGRLFLSRERAGLTAFELPSGKPLWFQPIYERPQPAFDYTAQGRYEWLLQNLALVGRPQSQLPPSLSQSSAPEGAGGHLRILETAQRDYEASRTRYEQLRFDPNATAAQRGAAGDRLRLAAEANLAATQTDVALGRAMASMNFGMSVLNFALGLAEQQKARQMQGILDRVQIMMQGAKHGQQRAFQGEYYLRPFYKRGRGVTIVSLATGRRRDVVFSPHSEPLNAFGVDLPMFTIGPRGSLVVFGLSLRTDRYVERSLGKSKIPVLSLMSYDVPSMTLIERQRDWGWITDFVKAGDQPALLRALQSGDVDVNSRHWAAGESALIWAVAQGRLDIARILVERGIDVNQISDIGNRALDVARTDEMRNYLLSVGAKPGPPAP
jgi:outer membrane protein assembly factor BamB